ncbi:MAG: hypothetical protein LUC91_02900 [Prevotella sp.]|nr:hypothetical protein [Prevotella sp.]
MKRSYLSKSMKRGLLSKFTFLLVALLSMNISTYAVEESDIVELELGKTYELTMFTHYYFSYTAEQSGSVIIAGSALPDLYTDATFTEILSDNVHWDGYVDGGQQETITVTGGETYYLHCYSMENSPYFIATYKSSGEGPEITYLNPEAGSELNIQYDEPIALKFSEAVTVGTATLTSGELSVPLTLNLTNGYYSYPVRDVLYTWLTSGAVSQGDDIIFTLTDIKNSYGTVYGEDGTVTIVYKAPAAPTEVTEENLPDVFLPWWNEGDENGIMTLTFSNDISADEDLAPKVELRYGQVDTEVGIYLETMSPVVDGNKLSVDFTGKSRLRKEMLSSATENFDKVVIRVTNLHDVNGNYVYTTGQGSVGSLTYEIGYKEFTITPSDSAVVESISQVVIEYGSGIKLDDPSSVTIQNYVEQEVAVGTSVEAVTEEGSDMPTKLIITLDKTITDNGYYFVIIPKNSLMINYPDYVEYAYKISEVFEIDSSTGIGSISMDSSVGNGKIYTIDGQLVKSPTKKGIYIVNGKKIVVK